MTSTMSTSVHINELPSLVLEQVFEWGCTEELEPRYSFDQPVNRRVRHPFLSNVSEVCRHWHATAQHAPPSCWFIALRLRESYPEGITIAGVLEEYREALETSKGADLHIEWQCLGFAGVKADPFIKAMNMVIPYQGQIRTLSCKYSEDNLDRQFYSFIAQLDRAHSLHSMYCYASAWKELGSRNPGGPDLPLPPSFQVQPGALLGLRSLRISVDSESLVTLVPPQNLSRLHFKYDGFGSLNISYSDIIKLIRQLLNLTYLVFPKSMVLKLDGDKPVLEPPSNPIPLLFLSYLRVHQSDPLVAMAVLTCSEFRNLKSLELDFTLETRYSQDSFKEYRRLECPDVILPDFCYIKVYVTWGQIETLAILSRFMRPPISQLTMGFTSFNAVNTPEPTQPSHISVDRLWLMGPNSKAFDSLFHLVHFDVLNTLKLDPEYKRTSTIGDWSTCWERHRSQLLKVNKLEISSLDLQRGLFPACLRCFANIKHFTCRLLRPWESDFPGNAEEYRLSTVFDYFLPGLDDQLPFLELTSLEVVAEAVGQDDQVLVEDIESGLESVATARAELGAPVQVTSNARDRLKRGSSRGGKLLK